MKIKQHTITIRKYLAKVTEERIQTLLLSLKRRFSLSEAPEIDAKVIDGATIINMLKLKYGKTFPDYGINTFVPYIFSLVRQVKLTDLVWDRYFAESLKNSTRGKCGVGIRRKVTDNWLLPKCLMTFLRYSENKPELFPYLLNVIVIEIQNKVVVSTLVTAT